MPRPTGSKNAKPAGVRINARVNQRVAEWLKSTGNITGTIERLCESAMKKIENYKPGQKFVVWPNGTIAYLSDTMQLLDTGKTLDNATCDVGNLPNITDEDAAEYQSAHGQDN